MFALKKIHIITTKIENLDTIHTNSQSAAKCIELLNIKIANIKVKWGSLLGKGVN
jgi:hypothetical protein